MGAKYISNINQDIKSEEIDNLDGKFDKPLDLKDVDAKDSDTWW
jgi:hypothetical protein